MSQAAYEVWKTTWENNFAPSVTAATDLELLDWDELEESQQDAWQYASDNFEPDEGDTFDGIRMYTLYREACGGAAFPSQTGLKRTLLPPFNKLPKGNRLGWAAAEENSVVPPLEPMPKTLLFDVASVSGIGDPVTAGTLSNTATLDVMFPDVSLDVSGPVTVDLSITEDTAQDEVATAYAAAWQAADTNVANGDFFDVTAEGTKLFITGKNGTGNLGSGFGFALISSDTTYTPDALVEADLEAMTVTELKALARRRGLRGYSGLSKEELIDLLSGCEQTDGAT